MLGNTVNVIVVEFSSLYVLLHVQVKLIRINYRPVQRVLKSICFCHSLRKMPLQLLEGMSSRKRRPNWTDPECLLLAQLMQERKDIIRGKCSTGVSIQDKRLAWEEIAQAINTAFPHIQRTVSDCNKKWENLLAKSREEIKRQKVQAVAGEENQQIVS